MPNTEKPVSDVLDFVIRAFLDIRH